MSLSVKSAREKIIKLSAGRSDLFLAICRTESQLYRACTVIRKLPVNPTRKQVIVVDFDGAIASVNHYFLGDQKKLDAIVVVSLSNKWEVFLFSLKRIRGCSLLIINDLGVLAKILIVLAGCRVYLIDDGLASVNRSSHVFRAIAQLRGFYAWLGLTRAKKLKIFTQFADGLAGMPGVVFRRRSVNASRTGKAYTRTAFYISSNLRSASCSEEVERLLIDDVAAFASERKYRLVVILHPRDVGNEYTCEYIGTVKVDVVRLNSIFEIWSENNAFVDCAFATYVSTAILAAPICCDRFFLERNIPWTQHRTAWGRFSFKNIDVAAQMEKIRAIFRRYGIEGLGRQTELTLGLTRSLNE